MSSTGTRKERNVQTRVTDALTENDRIFIENLKLFSADTNSVAGLAGATISNSPKTPTGNYLAREGDSMIGPIALGPPVDFTVDVDKDTNTIDIGILNDNPQYSSNIQLENNNNPAVPEDPSFDTLDIIAGAAFDGQILIIRTLEPSVPYNIRQGTLDNGGNISTLNNEDFQMTTNAMIFLVFDASLQIEENTGGSWRVLSGSGESGGEDPTVLKNLNEKNHGVIGGITLQLDWKEANLHRLIANDDIDIAFIGLPAVGKWSFIIFEITQDGNGSHTINFGQAPFLNGVPVVGTNPNETTSLEFYSYNNGIDNVIVWALKSGSQTPWLQNVDANKFILFDLNEVLFTDTVLNAPSATTSSIFWSNATSDFVFQIQEGNDFKIIQGITETVGNTVATFNKSTIDFGIQTLPFTVLETGDLLNQGIAQFNKTVTLKTNNVTFPQPSIRPSTDVLDPFDGGDLGTSSVAWNNLFVKQIRFQDGFVISNTHQISRNDSFNGLVINVPTGKQINLFIDGDERFIVASGVIEVFTDMDFNNLSSINNVSRVTFSETFGAGNSGANTIYTQSLNNFFVFQARANDQIRFLQGDDFVSDVFATFTKSIIDFTHETLPFTSFFAGDTIIKGISNFRKQMTLVTDADPGFFVNPNFTLSEDVIEPNKGGDLGSSSVPWNNLNVKQIRLRNGTVIIDIASIAFDSDVDGTVYNVPNGNSHLFKQFDGVSSTDTLFEINESEIDAFEKIIRNVVDPIAAQDVATKNYVDTIAGRTWKVPVRVKSDGFTFLFPRIQQIIDGVTLVEGDRVLLTDELNGKNNGIWEVVGPFTGIPLTAPLLRPSDFNSDSDMVSEVFVAVEEGVFNAKSVWHLTTPNPIFDNITSQTWEIFKSKTVFDVTNGTLDVLDEPYYSDNTFTYWGKFSRVLSNVLTTSEPGSPPFTFTHIITANDLPKGLLGWEYVSFSAFSSFIIENSTGEAGAISFKVFVNDDEVPGAAGTRTFLNADTWIAISMDTGEAKFLQAGDTLQFSFWISTGVVGPNLDAFALFMYPNEITVNVSRVSARFDGLSRNGQPPNPTNIGTFTRFKGASDATYIINDPTQQSFALWTEPVGFKAFFGEKFTSIQDPRDDTIASSIRRLSIPESEFFATYQVHL